MDRTWNRFVIAVEKNRVLRLSRVCAYDFILYFGTRQPTCQFLSTQQLSEYIDLTFTKIRQRAVAITSCCKRILSVYEAFNRKRSPAVITFSTFTEHMHTRTHPRKISQILERLITDESFRIRPLSFAIIARKFQIGEFERDSHVQPSTQRFHRFTYRRHVDQIEKIHADHTGTTNRTNTLGP